MRIDLILLPVVAILIGYVVMKYARPGKAGKVFYWYVWLPACVLFFLYWLITGELW